MTAWLLASSIKAALLLAASGLGVLLLRRSTAAARHQMWALGIGAALVVPLLGWMLPSLLSVKAPMIDAGRELHADAIVVTAGTDAAPTPLPWLAIAWATGALAMSLRFLRGHLAARRIARSAERIDTVDGVGVYRTDLIESPMTVGVLRSRVLLPVAADAWSPERLRAVLVHELGHVQRRDILIQLGAQIACALYWWNPLVWIAAARLRVEREYACDDRVIDAGVRPSSYAADLLDLSRSSSAVAHAGACMADHSRIEVRLRRILDQAAPRGPLGAGFRFVARGTALACAVAIACTSAAADHESVAEVATIATPAVTIGAPSVHGPEQMFGPRALPPGDANDLALVATEVNRHAAALKRCYEQRLRVRPELAGEVVIHWSIAGDGKVVEQCITTDTVGDAEVAACVNQLVEASYYPGLHGVPMSVSFPFVFRPVK